MYAHGTGRGTVERVRRRARVSDSGGPMREIADFELSNLKALVDESRHMGEAW